jgi:hypothetical protein
MEQGIILAGSIAGAIITIISLIALLRKPILNFKESRKKKKDKAIVMENNIIQMKEMLQEHTQKDKLAQEILTLHGEALLCILRNEITKTYYKFLPSKALPTYEQENLIKQHTTYHNLNGNSYIDKIFEEMMTWETIA